VLNGDGSGLAVSHVGSLNLQSTHRNFTLHDTLYVPNLCKNLIYVHHFTKQNNVFVELHHFHFFVKDATTGAILLKGACNNGIYIFPDSLVTPQKVANVHEWTSIDGWHKRLGHPSLKIVHHLVKNFSLPISSQKTFSSLCHRKKLFHLYVILVPLIKYINNPFVAPVFKAMHPLNLFTRMCGVQLVILELMVQDTILFLWITIQNIFGSIQWQLNLVSLIFFHCSKSLLKLVFKNQSKHSTLPMEVNLLL